MESLTMSLKNSEANGSQEEGLSEEKRAKISEVRNLLEPVPDKLLLYCSDASIARYLRARNWNVKKVAKMLKETLKWRLEYKPEYIRWDEIAQEAETGKIYRSNCLDKNGRCILVMRPGCENSKSTKGRIRYLVYCMENAILNLPSDQEQMIWLIDFCGYNMSNLSVKVTKETADVLQNHYPERLGLAILYNSPKFFEPFWLTRINMAMLRHASFSHFVAAAVAASVLLAGESMAQTNQLLSGDVLTTGQNISNSDYSLVMQPDCNLVLYRNPSQAVWYTHTNDKGSGCELQLTTDGNLVISDKDGKLVWQSGTNGTVGHYVLLIQRDRNVVIYSKPIWDSGTGTVLTPVSIIN